VDQTEDQAQLDHAQQVLQVKFRDENWLFHALTCVLKGEDGNYFHNNEFDRLELRGDAVLKLVVMDDLLRRESGKLSGYVTDLNYLLGNWFLGIVGLNLGLGKLQMGDVSRWRLKPQGRCKRSADIVETLIGAVFCDQGIEAASNFIYSRILPGLMRLMYPKATQSLRWELAKYFGQAVPQVQVISTVQIAGGAHVAKVELLHRGERLGTGYGANKAQAEEEAVRRILRQKFGHEVW